MQNWDRRPAKEGYGKRYVRASDSGPYGALLGSKLGTRGKAPTLTSPVHAKEPSGSTIICGEHPVNQEFKRRGWVGVRGKRVEGGHHPRGDGSMQWGRLVDAPVQDVVERQGSGGLGGVAHLLADDKEVGLLGVMNEVLHPRGKGPVGTASPSFPFK